MDQGSKDLDAMYRDYVRFFEVHEDPPRALCDGPNSIALSDVEPMLRSVLAVDRAVKETA